MKNKKTIISIGISIFFIITAVISMAAGGGLDFGLKERALKADISAMLTVIGDIKEGSDIELLRKILKENGYYEDEILLALNAYVDIASRYAMTKEESIYIIELVQREYDLIKLLSIYQFTYGMNKGVDFIKDVYNESEGEEYNGQKFWLENSYSKLSAQKENALSQRDIEYFVAAGVTIDEILMMDELTRDAGKELKELLEKRKNRVSWRDIVCEIYPGIDKEKLDVEEDLFLLYDIVNTAKILKSNFNEVYDKNEPDKIKKETRSELIGRLERKEYLIEKSNIRYNKDEIISLAAKKIPQMGEEEITKYIEEGYTIRDIEKGLKGAKKEEIVRDEVEKSAKERGGSLR